MRTEPLLLEAAPENHGCRNRNMKSQVWVGDRCSRARGGGGGYWAPPLTFFGFYFLKTGMRRAWGPEGPP